MSGRGSSPRAKRRLLVDTELVNFLKGRGHPTGNVVTPEELGALVGSRRGSSA